MSMWARKLAPWAEVVCSVREAKTGLKALVAGRKGIVSLRVN